MIFLDGVGIGKKDARRNPFFAVELKTLRAVLGGHIPHLRGARLDLPAASLIPVNATLGVPGLPQSGTGQVALLTGFNAPRFVGKHFGPYPYSTLKPIIRERNIFQKLIEREKRVLYANAFPRQFFQYIHSNSKKNRITASTMSWLSSGFELNDYAALAAGKAVSSDITNERWHTLGYPDLKVITPREAGVRLAELTGRYDFVLFEYFFTDHAGHSQSFAQAADVLTKLDLLLEGVFSKFEHDTMLLILTSDHGNIEDLATKTHTRNPVPLLAVGSGHRMIAQNIRSLTHITPAILEIMT